MYQKNGHKLELSDFTVDFQQDSDLFAVLMYETEPGLIAIRFDFGENEEVARAFYQALMSEDLQTAIIEASGFDVVMDMDLQPLEARDVFERLEWV